MKFRVVVENVEEDRRHDIVGSVNDLPGEMGFARFDVDAVLQRPDDATAAAAALALILVGRRIARQLDIDVAEAIAEAEAEKVAS